MLQEIKQDKLKKTQLCRDVMFRFIKNGFCIKNKVQPCFQVSRQRNVQNKTFAHEVFQLQKRFNR